MLQFIEQYQWNYIFGVLKLTLRLFEKCLTFIQQTSATEMNTFFYLEIEINFIKKWFKNY